MLSALARIAFSISFGFGIAAHSADGWTVAHAGKLKSLLHMRAGVDRSNVVLMGGEGKLNIDLRSCHGGQFSVDEDGEVSFEKKGGGQVYECGTISAAIGTPSSVTRACGNLRKAIHAIIAGNEREASSQIENLDCSQALREPRENDRKGPKLDPLTPHQPGNDLPKSGEAV